MRWSPSLYRHLLAWTLGSLALVWAAFIFFAYRTGIHEADELTDGHLASVASLLLMQPATRFGPGPDAATLGGRTELRAHDYQQSLSVFVWDGQGRLVARTGEAATPPFSEAEGFETIALGRPAVHWRSFSRWDGPQRGRRVTVLLSLVERDGLAEDIAEQVATPGLWLLPTVAVILGLAIRRGLRPLADLGQQVAALDIQRDAALRAPPHVEFQRIVQAIDTLVARYNQALERERALASEVAHELRTPLASIALNVDAVERGRDAEERAAALRQVREDAVRAGAVIGDLLALARASRAELAEVAEPVDLAELARGVVAEYGERAWRAGQELSLEAGGRCEVPGHRVLLQIALRNLIENAIQHTPAGTRIEVVVQAEPAGIEVRDDGPMLAAEAGAQRPWSPGLGLGHQVVAKIAAVHEGRFEVEAGDASRPQRYRLSLGRGARDG